MEKKKLGGSAMSERCRDLQLLGLGRWKWSIQDIAGRKEYCGGGQGPSWIGEP